MSTFTESGHKEFNMEDFKKRQRAAKIQGALDALKMTTPGDWWVDDRGELLNDLMGNFKLGKSVGGGAPLWDASNRKVIAASRELAEEVLRLRGSNNRLREVITKFWESAQRATPAPAETWKREYELVHPSVVGVDMPGPGCRDHGVRTTAHKEGDVLVVDSVEVIPNTSGPDVSCDVCVPNGFPSGATCPKCGRVTYHLKVPE